MSVDLRDYQVEALKKMHNGCILNGDVGTGKSRVSLAYYYTLYGGHVNTSYDCLMSNPSDLYIITTAKKRDSREWNSELIPFLLSTDKDLCYYHNTVVIDSWNNIDKYTDIYNAFFIFDEQRVIGSGAWVKAFYKIAKKNRWILLSATPGDTWHDYVPVFVANGFFTSKTDFERRHCIFNPYTKWKSVQRYIYEGHLIKLRDSLLVPMQAPVKKIRHYITIPVGYSEFEYKAITSNRWNPYKDKPIENASEYVLTLRRLVNSHPSRIGAVFDILMEHPKVILFYSYDYELDIIRQNLDNAGYPYSEWNGHKHEKILDGDKWVYVVEYIAGAESWNCITTDTMIFYSQCYSYRMMEQSCGRIDRMNSPYKELYYYTLKSKSDVDIAIMKAINRKAKFNEKNFAPEFKGVKDGKI